MTTTEARFILGLPPIFSDLDLKRAYRRAASANHPDRGGRTEEMVAVNEAHQVLLDRSIGDVDESTAQDWSTPTWSAADADAFYSETSHRPEPEHPSEPYVRYVSMVLAAVWWIAGIFDLLDQPRRLRPWILIGFPFAYLIVWPLVRFTVRCGSHVYSFLSRARRHLGPFATR